MPIGKAKVRAGDDVTIVAFSHGQAGAAGRRELRQGRYRAEVIDLRTMRPFDIATVVASVKKTNRIVSVEEGWPFRHGLRSSRRS